MPRRLSEERGRSSFLNQAKMQQILNNITYRSFETTVSQFKISVFFSGEIF